MAKKKATAKSTSKKPKLEMDIEFEDGKLYQYLIESVSSILSEVNIIVDETGVMLAGMDLSHICLVYLFIAKEDFTKFEIDNELELGVNLEDMVKMLKRLQTNDSYIMKKQSNEKKIQQIFKDKRERTFNLALIDLEMEQTNLESLKSMEYSNVFDIDTEVLDGIIKDAEIFADVIKFESNGEKIVFSSLGNVGDHKEIVTDDNLITINEIEDGNSGFFAITFLKNILKIKSFIDTVQIKFQFEKPLQIKGSFLEKSEMFFALAPRVDDEDDYDDTDNSPYAQK